MNSLLCFLFAGICLLVLLQAMQKPGQLYRFPFLFCFACVVFILPSAYAALDHLKLFPQINYPLAMGNALACLICALAGYYTAPSRSNRTFSKFTYDLEKLFHVNLITLALGIAASLYLFRMGDIEEWRGLPVYLSNVARFLRPGILIAITVALLRPAGWKWAVVCGSMVFPVINMALFLRRSEVFFYGVLIAFPFYFIRRKTIPRAAIPLALVGCFLFIILVPVYRDYSSATKRTTKQVDARQEIQGFLSGERTNEFLEAAESMEIIRKWGNYDMGIWFLNNLIVLYVPRGIFGADFKQSLILEGNGPNIIELRERHGTSAFKGYLAQTGFAQAFFAWGYCGCLFFFFFARICRFLENKAFLSGDLRHILIYCYFAVFIPYSVSTSITEIPGIFLPPLVILLGTTFLCRRKVAPQRSPAMRSPKTPTTVRTSPC